MGQTASDCAMQINVFCSQLDLNAANCTDRHRELQFSERQLKQAGAYQGNFDCQRDVNVILECPVAEKCQR